MKKKIGITLEEEFLKDLEEVGQVNQIKVSEVCRLILINQLTFYRKTGKVPLFKVAVQMSFENLSSNRELFNEPFDPEAAMIAKTPIPWDDPDDDFWKNGDKNE